MPPTYKREIELLSGFVRDLRRLPKNGWDLSGPPYWECDDIKGTLHRRLPGVRAVVTKAGVTFVGPFGEEKSFDFLAHAVEHEPRANVLRILEEAIGAFEHRLVPAPPSARTALAARPEAAPAAAVVPIEPEVKPLSASQREIDLLAAFARDLKRFHGIGPLLDAKLQQERQELEDALNRRVPAVRRAVERADVPRHGTDMASGRFDYLNLILEKHVFENVWSILQQAIGVFENDIVPDDLRRREEEEKRKREEEDRRPLPRVVRPDPLPMNAATLSPAIPSGPIFPERRVIIRYLQDLTPWETGQEVSTPLAVALPLVSSGVAVYVPEPDHGKESDKAFNQFNDALREEVADAVRDSGTGIPASEPATEEKPRRSLKARVEEHPFFFLVGVAIAAFTLGVTVGAWGRDGWDAAVGRLNARAGTNAPAPAAAARSRPPGAL